MRLILLLLALMFFGSGLLKISSGQWISDPLVMRNMFLIHNVIAVDSFFGPNLLNPLIASTPLIYLPLQASALAFETLFPLVLINQHWRGFFISAAVIFHSINYFFFSISFVPQLGLYLLFVDWQAVIDWLQLSLKLRLRPWPTPVLIAGALVAVAGGVLLWTVANPLALLIRHAPTAWLLAGPISLFFMTKYGLALLRDGQDYVRHKRRANGAPGTVQRQA
jgi:hypothetical protein